MNTPEDKYYPDDAFEALYRLEEKNFWFRIRNKIIGNLISRYLSPQSRILEVGCGTGYVSGYLKKLGYHMECSDQSLNALEFCKRRESGMKYYQYNLMEPLFTEEFDGICVFDVLEHIEDDSIALKNLHDSLKQGGTLFLTVPADQRLWSAMDIYYIHKRRYSAEELRIKLEANGFAILKMSYFMTFLYPLLLLSRKFHSWNWRKTNTTKSMKTIEEEVMSELKPNIFQNSLFFLIFSWESHLLRSVNFPFGSSLLCVAIKR
jgi:2-polyprenyl-3-methyl-5-hydroxy-6-metoxy-1,4-benzoquinol methylase